MLVPVEHACPDRRGVGVVGHRIPGPEHEIVERCERHEVADQRGATFGALAQTDGAHLREGADRLGAAAAHVLDTGDERGRHRAESDAEHAELSLRRRDPPGPLFSHC